MRKILFPLSVLLTISTASFAQMPYDVSVKMRTYQPITNGTSVNGTTIWDDDDFTVPLGFNFDIGGKATTDISFVASEMCFGALTGTQNGFYVTDMDIFDRGDITGVSSRSPIRYEVVGTTPNRVFRYEVFNAGMYDEYDLYGTDNDSINYQVWFYEIDNTVELHYGPSNISHPADYHYISGSAIVGYIKDFDLDNFGLGKIYYLKGDPAAPTIDSADSNNPIMGGLNSYPPNGTVYRFAPKGLDVKKVSALDGQLAMVTNTSSTDVVINNNAKGSLTYSILSIDGASMNITGKLTEGRNQIDISALAAGMYMLQVQGAEGQKAFKVVKL